MNKDKFSDFGEAGFDAGGRPVPANLYNEKEQEMEHIRQEYGLPLPEEMLAMLMARAEGRIFPTGQQFRDSKGNLDFEVSSEEMDEMDCKAVLTASNSTALSYMTPEEVEAGGIAGEETKNRMKEEWLSDPAGLPFSPFISLMAALNGASYFTPKGTNITRYVGIRQLVKENHLSVEAISRHTLPVSVTSFQAVVEFFSEKYPNRIVVRVTPNDVRIFKLTDETDEESIEVLSS